jgi:hypothetical protein
MGDGFVIITQVTSVMLGPPDTRVLHLRSGKRAINWGLTLSFTRMRSTADGWTLEKKDLKQQSFAVAVYSVDVPFSTDGNWPATGFHVARPLEIVAGDRALPVADR